MALEANAAGVEGASCEGAVILKMLQDSKAPYFKKTITDVMLRRSESVVIPKGFSRTYDDIFHTPELSFTGPSGHTLPVMLKVRSRDRIYLNRGWLDFVHWNDFQVGDQLLFWMVKRATFRVFLCSPDTLPKESGSDNNSILSGISSKDDKLDPNEFSEGEFNLKVYHRRAKPGTAVSKCATNCNPAITPIYGDPAEVEDVKKRPSREFVKHPNLSTLGFRFPSFLRKLSRISLPSGHDIHLELPFPFVQEHGHKFQAHVFLLGPSGHARLVSLSILSTGRRGGSRVQIRAGWKNFALENGFKMGDLLRFSLVGLSKFVVQSIPFV